MLTIWFIGMYVIFIIQQITILYENIKKDKLQERIDITTKKIKQIQINAIKYGVTHDASICEDLINMLNNRGGKK